MLVTLVIQDNDGLIIYDANREMEFIPNIGEGIFLDLDDEAGWNGRKYCDYAVCIEKYQVFNRASTSHIVCKFIGENIQLIPISTPSSAY